MESWIELIFLHVDSDAIFFGYTDNSNPVYLTFKCRESTSIVLVYLPVVLVTCNSVLKFIRIKDHSRVLKHQHYQIRSIFENFVFFFCLFFEIRVFSKFHFLVLNEFKRINSHLFPLKSSVKLWFSHDLKGDRSQLNSLNI